MRRSGRNRWMAAALMIALAACLAACGSGNGQSLSEPDTGSLATQGEEEAQDLDSGEDATSEAGGSGAGGASSEMDEAGTASEVDLGSEKAIREFLTGEWKILDVGSGEDYARMSFAADGSCTLELLSKGMSCDGKLSFEHVYAKESDAPDYFRRIYRYRVGFPAAGK